MMGKVVIIMHNVNLVFAEMLVKNVKKYEKRELLVMRMMHHVIQKNVLYGNGDGLLTLRILNVVQVQMHIIPVMENNIVIVWIINKNVHLMINVILVYVGKVEFPNTSMASGHITRCVANLKGRLTATERLMFVTVVKKDGVVVTTNNAKVEFAIMSDVHKHAIITHIINVMISIVVQRKIIMSLVGVVRSVKVIDVAEGSVRLHLK